MGNLGVTGGSKTLSMVEFDIIFEDQEGKRVAMDAVDIYLLDLDRDQRLTLREQACYDLDTFDLAGSKIPGFDTKALAVKKAAADPGFAGPPLTAYYDKTKTCTGSTSTTLGSVHVEANQVGYICDFPLDVAVEDMKPIKCRDPGCFTEKACRAINKKKAFGTVDKDGKTCTLGAPGCTFEAGINPASRIIDTRYIGKSSLRITLGIDCVKKAGETCTRNFVFRAAYQNVKKACGCAKTELKQFLLDDTTIKVNNLGGLGPDVKLAKEMRFAKVAMNAGGDHFDVVATVAAGSSYKSIFADVRNGPNGKLGEINIDVPVTASNNGLQMTTFEFEIRDSITGDPLVMDEYFVSFYDLDVNKAMNLHERICINGDQFDSKKSSLPSGGDVKVTRSDLKNCAGTASSSGSVLLESQGVGFLCDNPKDYDDLTDVPCEKCFNKVQCGKDKVSKFFPIKRSQRVATLAFSSRSKFSISLGISCEKAIGETCNRNFLFSASQRVCADGKKAPATTKGGPKTFKLFAEGKQCSGLESLGYLASSSGKKDSVEQCLKACADNSACNAVIFYKRVRWCSHYERMCDNPTSGAKNAVTYVVN